MYNVCVIYNICNIHLRYIHPPGCFIYVYTYIKYVTSTDNLTEESVIGFHSVS